MNGRMPVVLSTALATSLAACSTTVVPPPVVGLYKSAQCQSNGVIAACGEPTASVSVVGNAPASDPATSPATHFAERAEAEYIKALADPRMSKDAGALGPLESVARDPARSASPQSQRHDHDEQGGDIQPR